MKIHLFVILAVLVTDCGALVGQQTTSTSSAVKKSRRSPDNPTYSAAIFQGRDPHEYLAEAENTLQRSPSLRAGLNPLAEAAKRALEAGEVQKALDYATRALAIADDWDKELSKQATGRALTYARMGKVGQTAFYANFVLGRLAMIKGDIRTAEQYLLASGKTVGSATLCSYGPNMSLALELLKHGDDHSRQVVLLFLDEISTFWKIDPSPIPKWTAEITAGRIPDFEAAGMNLYY